MFSKVWGWFKSIWQKHDSQVAAMAKALLPLVVAVARRSDLTGEQKRRAVLDAVLDSGEVVAEEIATSVLNEALEVAANRYKIEIGALTPEKIDKTAKSVVAAGRALADKQFDLQGDEAEEAGLSAPAGD